jgi:hypothetical protein
MTMNVSKLYLLLLGTACVLLGSNASAQAPDFGDDSSSWSQDGECDDPRFQGTGMASTLLDEDRFSDATDCRDLFNLGRITLVSGGPVEFGDNSSSWSHDGECDDPRFQGSGMASTLIDADRFSDATDCRLLFNQGRITMIGSGGNVNFGDDSSQWSEDGECDDPRFQGTGMASTLLDEDRFSDATDCRDLFNLGRITLR